MFPWPCKLTDIMRGRVHRWEKMRKGVEQTLGAGIAPVAKAGGFAPCSP